MAELPGASIAILSENELGEHYVVAIQRDDKPDIPYPGWWELPGGTLEPGEDSEAGAVREGLEEVAIYVEPHEITGNDQHLVEGTGTPNTTLVVAIVSLEKVLRMQLGSEGKDCKLIELGNFLVDASVIPEHRMRLRRYLVSVGYAALAQYGKPELARSVK